MRTFRWLLALVVVTGCRSLGPSPSASPPSHLKVETTTALGTQLDPCADTLAVSVTARVAPQGLEKLSGSVRAQRSGDPKGPSLQATVAELAVTYRTTSGTELATQTVASHVPPAAASQTWVSVPLAVSWNGVVTTRDGLVPAPAGPITADGTVSVVRVTGTDRQIIREEVLQSAGFTLAQKVVPASESCREWMRTAPSLAKGPNGTVLVHGQPSASGPQITWRKGRPLFIFGDMGHGAGPGGRVDAVKAFLRAHPALFGITNPAVVDTLAPAYENDDPDGTIRVVLSQGAEVTRAGIAATGPTTARLSKSRLSAVFDSTGELVLLAGRFREDVSPAFAVTAITEQQAVAAVEADLAARGLATGRTIRVKEEIIFRDAAGAYRPAYLIAVGKGNRTAFPSEPPASRLQTFDYTVMMQTGAILNVRNRSLPISVTGRVRVYDVNDPAPVASDLQGDQGFTSCPPPFPHSQPGLRRGTGGPALRINNHPTSRDPFFLSDSNEPTGVIEEVNIDPDGGPYEWASRVAFRMHRSDPMEEPRAVRAMTAYDQIQRFWDDIPAQLLPSGSWDLLTLVIDSEDMTNACIGGQYDNDQEISFPSFYPTLALMAPTHEAFHHFDHATADLENGEDHPMPDALKEGTASFFMQPRSPFVPDNAMGVGTGVLLCVWTRHFHDCMEPWRRIQRAHRIVPTPSHRPVRDGETDLSAWPDCRVPDGRNFHCLFAARPTLDTSGNVTGGEGDLSWKGLPFNSAGGSQLVTQILVDLWESGASLEPDPRFLEVFSMMVAKAFSLLDEEPSLGDLRDCLLFTNILFGSQMPANGVTQAAIANAFERHGIDGTVDQLCSDAATEDLCH